MNTDLALQMQCVSKRYPHFQLEQVNLNLERGQIMGFIGPNGAGKSTTIRLLMGLIQADEGNISVLGQPMPQAQVAAKREIGFASEDMRLYPGTTLQWHMDFIQSIFPRWDAAYARTLLKRFDLRPDQRIKGLSHGQRVKAGLLLVLARRPRLLILDEPTTGLDPVARTEVLNELMEVAMDEDRSVLFSSHNTGDVEQISDQITFIDRGHIIRSQDKETFLESWRRIRIEAPENFELPQLPHLSNAQSSGRLTTLTTAQFDPHVEQRLRDSGAVIQAIDNMTLEEIFVAEVMSSRTGDAA